MEGLKVQDEESRSRRGHGGEHMEVNVDGGGKGEQGSCGDEMGRSG